MSLRKANRTTDEGGWSLSGGEDLPVKESGERIGVRRMAAAVVELARSRRRLAHRPTTAQVRTMARFEGRDPCSYLLDPSVNFVPELMFGYERELGRHALCFTGRLPHGVREFVAFSDGGGFDLLAGC
jgi:hypothetical protein